MSTYLIRMLPFVALLLTHANTHADERENAYRWHEVSGTAIHYFDNVPGRQQIFHSQTETENGDRLRSTETIDIFGDLNGRVLYHPTTVIDETAGTLVNTGHQVFSGTVLGSDPVLLHDDQMRFEVTFEPPGVTGKAFLVNRIAGPIVRCELDIVGTGETPERNGLAEYTGRCRMLGNPAKGPR